MCGYSKAKIGNEHVDLQLGFYGGEIQIGDCIYSIEKSWGELVDTRHLHSITPERTIFTGKLAQYSKSQLINLIADLVENAEED